MAQGDDIDRRAALSGERIAALPLFPLHTVLFPQGLLPLKVFEARYVDMVGQCLRDGTPFGVVQLHEGNEAGRDPLVRFDDGGTLALIEAVDAARPGILLLRCRGGHRCAARNSPDCHLRPPSMPLTRWPDAAPRSAPRPTPTPDRRCRIAPLSRWPS